jgi:outer membrane murein-binding lipoprotein Lpp
MVEFLKKLGVPALVAGIVGAMMTIIPILFKVDERYAKEQQLTSEVARLEGKIDDLTVEVGKLAGSTQVLVAVISAKQEAPRAIVRAAPIDFNKIEPSNAGGSSRAPASVDEAPSVATMSAPEQTPVAPIKIPLKIVPSQQLIDIAKSLESTQQRVQEIRQSQIKK